MQANIFCELVNMWLTSHNVENVVNCQGTRCTKTPAAIIPKPLIYYPPYKYTYLYSL